MMESHVTAQPNDIPDLSALLGAGSVLVDDLDSRSHEGSAYVFVKPERVLVAKSPGEVRGLLKGLDEAAASGKWAAGYLGYEAGLVLDKPIAPRHTPMAPLAWFGIYDKPIRLDYRDVRLGEPGSATDIRDVRLNVDEREYSECIARVKEYIAAGDVYQVNYTCKLRFTNHSSALGLFARLRAAHPVGYSAFINTGEFQVVSLSPELFLRRTGGTVLTRPMKGTCKRGRWFEDDVEHAAELAADIKNRAENLMIVDLMRNDIGRISEFGSVKTSNMFSVERFRTLFQMTTDVEGKLIDGSTSSDVIAATFPPGSVTGAPKIRALEIINELETEARGVYCGSIGFFEPNGDYLLNVAIRTIVQTGNQCEMGVGSGVVADSEAEPEYRETLLKGSFLKLKPASFRLLETLLYTPYKGYAFFDAHLARLRKSAVYFGWRIDDSLLRARLDEALDEAEDEMRDSSWRKRVRLLVSESGTVDVQWSPLGDAAAGAVKLVVSDARTDPKDVFLYHKTTQRDLYEHGLKSARASGFFDAVYLNNRGEITECSMLNFIIEMDGKLYTPPLDSGLLPGIWRARLLAEGRATERVLTLDDPRRATRVIVGNSVRGAIEVDSVETADGEMLFQRISP